MNLVLRPSPVSQQSRHQITSYPRGMASFYQSEILAVEEAFSGSLRPVVGQAVSAYLRRACEGLDGIDSQLAASARTRHASQASRAGAGGQAQPPPPLPSSTQRMHACMRACFGNAALTPPGHSTVLWLMPFVSERCLCAGWIAGGAAEAYQDTERAAGTSLGCALYVLACRHHFRAEDVQQSKPVCERRVVWKGNLCRMA